VRAQDDTEPTAARVERVAVTPEAEALLYRLADVHGPLVFHQSGGCCDGSSPMCFPRSEFRVGQESAALDAEGPAPRGEQTQG